jgi:hypothetical protein
MLKDILPHAMFKIVVLFNRCVPCGQDGVEEVAISSRDDTHGKWLHFDDEFVEVRLHHHYLFACFDYSRGVRHRSYHRIA